MNKTQLKKLITLVNQAVTAGPNNEHEGFTISSVKEIEKIWKLTAEQHVKFQKTEVSVLYKNVPTQFPFLFRYPWDWILEIVKDPHLAPNIAWEAQHKAQEEDELLDGYRLFMKIQMKQKKAAFINFKQAVWNESFHIFLQTLIETDEVGKWVTCGDGVLRWLFVIVLIFLADFEEYMTVSLTRGSNAHFPCPVCLVPKSELSNLSKLYKLRNQLEMKEIVVNAMAPGVSAAEREKELKEYGLQPVYNTFWHLKRCDIYQAISYDTLHSDDNGLWEDHFFTQFKKLISDRESISKIDSQFDQVPRWPGLNHFKSVMNISFNDGSKNRDISSIFIFAATCILGQDRESAAYQLLKLGQKELEKFGVEMQKYIDITIEEAELLVQEEEEEEDNTSKITGVARNFSTKPNESMHGPIRKSYHRRTNFKNFGDQILMADEMMVASSFIRSNLDRLDSWNNATADESDEPSCYTNEPSNLGRLPLSPTALVTHFFLSLLPMLSISQSTSSTTPHSPDSPTDCSSAQASAYAQALLTGVNVNPAAFKDASIPLSSMIEIHAN
ncbi:hypothetical protein AGABI1DRAFT_132682 [Agaricus bisporus var. burnettii JB137-S8]|uniref:Uncharacterized protein n=1 Tax=Agaricus bisporus var. burnettii (strain JB137-S8 / ATCC MYA-4627 / FGSC 10392) TaxID=597362 RepID=K5WWL9_AGABU|nr:uncharacterized protein AGABI1DRAFT_132682 [Agaricus bisporus var. burnettii JB137-S8]EKM74987.1 hypothetical protein AGABI1DRAFT_132682 [Agaricus bisporus var. burnettii JB137-S8]